VDDRYHRAPDPGRQAVLRERGARSSSRSGSTLDELLAAVDVERRPSNGRVRHQVDG
jgi:hypothetical protein